MFYVLFSFSNDTEPTEIYTLSLHDALPIWTVEDEEVLADLTIYFPFIPAESLFATVVRSEEHTSELQSQSNLVCRLLLEKKKKRSTRRLTKHIKSDERDMAAPDRGAKPPMS